MPKYEYKCYDCAETFSVRLSMGEQQSACILCESDNLKKIVSDFTLSKKTTISKKEVGQEVKKYIEETREEVREEKKRLSSQIIE
jgi:putative FmdB family regulatory protein